MNAYLMFLNGIFLPPSFFSVEDGNSVNVGRFLRLVVDRDLLRAQSEDVKTIDVLEVRASNVVRRYRWVKGDKDGGETRELSADDAHKLPARIQFQCLTTPNTF